MNKAMAPEINAVVSSLHKIVDSPYFNKQNSLFIHLTLSLYDANTKS